MCQPEHQKVSLQNVSKFKGSIPELRTISTSLLQGVGILSRINLAGVVFLLPEVTEQMRGEIHALLVYLHELETIAKEMIQTHPL
jgi:hypothetical protein